MVCVLCDRCAVHKDNNYKGSIYMVVSRFETLQVHHAAVPEGITGCSVRRAKQFTGCSCASIRTVVGLLTPLSCLRFRHRNKRCHLSALQSLCRIILNHTGASTGGGIDVMRGVRFKDLWEGGGVRRSCASDPSNATSTVLVGSQEVRCLLRSSNICHVSHAAMLFYLPPICARLCSHCQQTQTKSDISCIQPCRSAVSR